MYLMSRPQFWGSVCSKGGLLDGVCSVQHKRTQTQGCVVSAGTVFSRHVQHSDPSCEKQSAEPGGARQKQTRFSKAQWQLTGSIPLIASFAARKPINISVGTFKKATACRWRPTRKLNSLAPRKHQSINHFLLRKKPINQVRACLKAMAAPRMPAKPPPALQITWRP
jgi:hypothetical protein